MSKRLPSLLLGVIVMIGSAARARAQETRAGAAPPPDSSPSGEGEEIAFPPEEPDGPGAAVPSLARVMELARARAPAVSVAGAEVEVGRASLVGARLLPLDNPYLEVFADRGTQGATRDITVQSNLWLPVEVSGQRERREAEASALVAWRRAEVGSARAAALAGAVRAYGQLAVAEARIRTLAELADVAREEAAYYQGRLDAGDVTIADAQLAELELAKHRVALAEGRADRVRALTALGLATGATYTDGPSGGPEPPPPRGAPAPNAGALPAVKVSEAQARYHAREKDRQAVEAHTPLNLILSMGRGDLGELRVGGGVAWTFPVLRRNQGEQARAEANRRKALLERDLKKKVAATTVAGLTRERAQVRKAIEAITKVAEPAAQAAVDAAVATQQAGKGDLLRVLSARRDLALLKARRLELLQREWNLVGDLVAITGDLP